MEKDETTNETEAETKASRPVHSGKKKLILWGGGIVVAALALVAGWYGLAYAGSPDTLRHPSMEHYHFRMQIIADGKYINLGDKEFQQGYAKDQCSGELADNPVHLHDNKDQFVHIHWEGITGGEVLKYYGWNYIGGNDNRLGYRFDQGVKPKIIPIHGKDLPKPASGDKFWVYTGDQYGYKERSWDDFLHKDLEKFFGKTSNFPGHTDRSSSLLDVLFPKAYAHAGHVHTGTEATEQESEEELSQINNLLGNVVIFVQKEKPSDSQIKQRFGHLEALSASTCGG